MTKPKVAVVLQQNQGTDFLTRSLPYRGYLFVSFTDQILLTCLVPQCTDAESAHPHRYVGPPTSPRRLAGRVTERLPS